MGWSRLALIVLSIGILACHSEPEPPDVAPNIVLIIGDDHGYPYSGFMGSEVVETPNLDRLAAEGTVFTHGFTTASECRPSLMSLLTGLHPEEWDTRLQHLETLGRTPPPFQEIREFQALPALLARKGYASFQGGKYWEGEPTLAGFTQGTWDTIGRNWGYMVSGGSGLSFGRETMAPLWDFLDEYGGKQPFFVWFAPLLPHRPHDPPAEFLDRYRRDEIVEQAQLYYANITRLDATVGELLRTLDEQNLRRDTLIVFVSDNGWDQPPDRPTNLMIGGEKGKHSIYELGFRTPIIFSWPGRIDEGVVRRELVSSVDLFPTFLDFAGVEIRPARMGVSLHPLLSGRGIQERDHVIGSTRTVRDEPLRKRHYRVRPDLAYFLRDPSWRYVWFVDRDTDELYRIEEDPRETRNVIEDHRQQALRYRREIEDWRRQIGESSTRDTPPPGSLDEGGESLPDLSTGETESSPGTGS
jgi:uncharacterized sulfatase